MELENGFGYYWLIGEDAVWYLFNKGLIRTSFIKAKPIQSVVEGVNTI